MIKQAKWVVAACCLCTVVGQAQPAPPDATSRRFGDERLAISFDTATGAWNGLWYRGRHVASGQDGAGFDIRQADTTWLSQGDAKPVLLSLTQDGPGIVRSEQRWGAWRVVCRYELLPAKGQLKRAVEIIWDGPEATKLRGFALQTPTLPFAAPGWYFQPGDFPPRRRLASDLTPGYRQGNGRSPWPTIVEIAPELSAVWLMDSLQPHADNGHSLVQEQADALTVSMQSAIAGHIRPAAPQKLGDFWLWLQDNGGEEALRRLPEWFADRGQVPPADRPDWVPRATLYSFHPGGSIGSGWQDWGGFAASTPQLSRMAELGCNALWILPVEDISPYHPRDYYKFMDGIGTADEYRALVSSAKNLGLRVWQDIVPHGGTNTYPRAIEHPEWLVQEEDGSTLGYWCFDFNWPEWIAYMKDVSRHYVREYGIDGYRIDACSGSKIPNWNPAIPYARASLSQSQGGLAMQRAIREGVREINPGGSTLAEVGGGIFGAVSDAIYDFAMCYSVFPAMRAADPAQFVAQFRRWLHEQQYSFVPDVMSLRHIESHDSLRAEMLYGPAPMRAAMAASAWIKGMPMVYQDSEDGHAPIFRKIFSLRRSLYEQGAGAVDYVSVGAPAGVFACLRQAEVPASPSGDFAWEGQGGWRASVAVVNFNPDTVVGTIAIPLATLPPALRQASACRELWNGLDLPARRSADGKSLDIELSLAPFGMAMLRLGGQASPPLSKDGLVAAPVMLPYELGLVDDKGVVLPLNDVLTGSGRLIHLATAGGAWQISQQRLADGTMAITATAPKAMAVPSGLLLRLPIAPGTPCEWRAQGAAGVWEDRFRTRHPQCDGQMHNIYHYLQGGNVLWNSLQNPLGFSENEARLSFKTAFGSLEIAFAPDAQPAAAFILDRVGDDHRPHVFLRWGVEEDVLSKDVRSMRFTLRRASATEKAGTGEPRLQAMAGGWRFDNGALRLLISTSGIITSHEVRSPDGAWRQLTGGYRLYTDAGYGEDGMRYEADADAEAFARFARAADGTLRLAFSGTMRGRGRFETMRQPLHYATEYCLGDGEGFGFAWAVQPMHASRGERAFVAMQQRLIDNGIVEFRHGDTVIARGMSDKNRAAETKAFVDQPLPDTIVLSNAAGQPYLSYTKLSWDGPERPENLFIHGQAMYLAWRDGEANATGVGHWRRASAWLSSQGAAPPADLAIATLVLPSASAAAGALRDPGFELGEVAHWLRKMVQLQARASSWTAPGGAQSVSEGAHGGRAAAEVIGAAGQYRLMAQAVSDDQFKAGTTWRLGCWARGEDIRPGPEAWMGAVLRFAYQQRQSDGRVVTRYSQSNIPMGSFAWQNFAVEWAVPEAVSSVSIQIGLNGNDGRLWIDDVSLERVEK